MSEIASGKSWRPIVLALLAAGTWGTSYAEADIPLAQPLTPDKVQAYKGQAAQAWNMKMAARKKDIGQPINLQQHAAANVMEKALSSNEMVYHAVTPCRLWDTRGHGGPYSPTTIVNFDVDGANLSAQGGSATGCGISTSANVAVIAITPVLPPGLGWMQGGSWCASIPAATLLNWGANSLTTTEVLVPMCGGAGSDVHFQVQNSSVDFVGDIVGYFDTVADLSLDCTDTGNTAHAFTASVGPFYDYAAACPSGYTRVSTTCYVGFSDAGKAYVFGTDSSNGYCAIYNYTGAAGSFYNSSRCCRL
jgi:hypothetical protein